MVNSSLGKGLSELMGNSFNEEEEFFSDNKDKIKEVLLEKIKPGKYQPRTSFNKEELENLSNSIKEKGVLQPILVKESDILGDYEIIAGERRYRASKLAGKEVISVIILDIDEKDAYEFALIENIQREKLNSLEEAIAIEKIISKFSYKQEEIAKKLGKSRSHIANMLRLLELPKELQNMLAENQISMGHAKVLVNKEKGLEVAKRIIEEGLSVRETEKLISKSVKEEKDNEFSQFNKQKQQYLDDLAVEASSLIDMDIFIKHNGKKGKMVIEFSDRSDVDYIMNIFKNYNNTITERD